MATSWCDNKYFQLSSDVLTAARRSRPRPFCPSSERAHSKRQWRILLTEHRRARGEVERAGAGTGTGDRVGSMGRPEGQTTDRKHKTPVSGWQQQLASRIWNSPHRTSPCQPRGTRTRRSRPEAATDALRETAARPQRNGQTQTARRMQQTQALPSATSAIARPLLVHLQLQ